MTTADLQSLPTFNAFRDAGCDRIFLKLLAENDNSKNQIYLGGSFDVLNALPLHSWRSESTRRGEILKASIDLAWLQADGSSVPALGAQLILYPQYPEVRLSGILKGVPRGAAPSSLVASRTAERLLVIGLRRDGTAVADVLAPDHQDVAQVRAAYPSLHGPGALKELELVPASFGTEDNARSLLLAELLRIHNRHWIGGTRLQSDGSSIPYGAANGVGYTLEAQLGIRPNGRSDPDFHGWEVKGLSTKHAGPVPRSKRITLLTPSPTGGDFRTLGPIGFVGRYGHPDSHDPTRMNFGGMFRAGASIGDHHLQLGVEGFDGASPTRFDAGGAVQLTTPDHRPVIEWSLAKMIAHWNRKHGRAVYVPALAEGSGAGRRYAYGSTVYLGTGTDFSRLLGAAVNGHLVYDPGLKVENFGKPGEILKQRHQFRISFKDLPALYKTWEEIDLDAVC